MNVHSKPRDPVSLVSEVFLTQYGQLDQGPANVLESECSVYGRLHSLSLGELYLMASTILEMKDDKLINSKNTRKLLLYIIGNLGGKRRKPLILLGKFWFQRLPSKLLGGGGECHVLKLDSSYLAPLIC